MVSPKSKATSEIGDIEGSEVMIVHANSNIPKGTEITWSYLPPCTPLAERRQNLLSKYGFTCQCMRCVKEEMALNVAEFKELRTLADSCWSSCDENQRNQWSATMKDLIPSIEKAFASTKEISNESQRYIRIGYSALYMDYCNMTISFNDEDKIDEALKLGTQLHFSFVTCNNASTEHLSIIHLCYDLSSILHTRAMKGSSPGAATAKTMTKVRFWTEQLKKAIMTRYGELGEDIENVRKLMKHSKMVLRNLKGWYLADDKFI